MKKHFLTLFWVLLIAILLVQCAKKGSPTGGPIDDKPPVILRIYPDNYTRNFKNQIIEIQFNEFVKLKDLQKQLVISPPLKTRPIITPQGGASKKITIQISDTLQDNTTYVLNFGESIVDNNEENAYPFFKYIFSTGKVIDSLTLKGKITDALNFEVDRFVNVMLYEVNESYTDSLVYKKSPRYVLNTLDSLSTFTMENLKEGTYKMVALKEENSDLRFDPLRDKIGFVSDTITVPSDKVYEVKMYQQELDAAIKKITQESASKFYVGYTGDVKGIKVQPVQETLIAQSRITKLEKKDTLQYWYQPLIKQDSVVMKTELKGKENNFTVILKELKKDSLVVKKESDFSLRTPASITASTPIKKLDTTFIKLMDKDSVQQVFNTKLDCFNNKAIIDFERKEEQNYKLTMFPGAIIDFYGAKNPDTLKYNFTTKKARDLGNFVITTSGGNTFPIILQVVKKDLKVEAELVITENGTYDFLYINPGEYFIRVIYDTNANGKYDAGNFLKNIQPEKVEYYPELQKLQANWDLRLTLQLNN